MQGPLNVLSSAYLWEVMKNETWKVMNRFLNFKRFFTVKSFFLVKKHEKSHTEGMPRNQFKCIEEPLVFPFLPPYKGKMKCEMKSFQFQIYGCMNETIFF